MLNIIFTILTCGHTSIVVGDMTAQGEVNALQCVSEDIGYMYYTDTGVYFKSEL